MATRQYIGARYVPQFADPTEWDRNRIYDPLTIVTYYGNSYTSKKRVPQNIELSNTEYWALTGNFNAQVEEAIEKNDEQDLRLTSLESANRAQDSAISSLQTRMTAAENVNNTQTSNINSLTTRMGNAESTNNTQTADINGLKTRVTNVENDKLDKSGGTVTGELILQRAMGTVPFTSNVQIADLNDLSSTGFWMCPGNTTNAPINSPCWIIVISIPGDRIVQFAGRVTNATDPVEVFARKYYGATWSDWELISYNTAHSVYVISIPFISSITTIAGHTSINAYAELDLNWAIRVTANITASTAIATFDPKINIPSPIPVQKVFRWSYLPIYKGNTLHGFCHTENVNGVPQIITDVALEAGDYKIIGQAALTD